MSITDQQAKSCVAARYQRETLCGRLWVLSDKLHSTVVAALSSVADATVAADAARSRWRLQCVLVFVRTVIVWTGL